MHELLTDLLEVVVRPAHQCLGIVGERGTVAVPDRQVLGADSRTIGCFPDKPARGHLRGHAAPHHRVGEPTQAQDLRHLRDVPEHVRQVADIHDAAEGGTSPDAHLQVPHNGLPRSEELVHQDVPGPHAHPARGGERPQAALVFRPYLEVVVDDRHLSVEHEVGVARVRSSSGISVSINSTKLRRKSW